MKFLTQCKCLEARNQKRKIAQAMSQKTEKAFEQSVL